MDKSRILFTMFGIVTLALCTTAIAQERETGSFRMSSNTTDVLGAAMAEGVTTFIALDEEVQWQVFVPETYDPSRPPGVFVFIDPDGWGGMPDQYRQLFTNRNMIWVGAKSNQRSPDVTTTMLTAMMAQRVIDQNYIVDLNRLFIGSGGDGALTVVNVLLRANEFNGAIYINGSAYWDGGKPDTFDYLMRKPHVFIIGSDDDNWARTRGHYENYKKDGIEKAELIRVKGKIRGWPETEQMDEALAILDAR
jgi:hypothetical protein